MAAPSIEFMHDDIRVLGHSLAGEETYIVLPQLNVGFDFGRCPRDVLTVDHVFLSHGHMDHAAGVAYYFSQRMFLDNAPGHAYVPAPLLKPINGLLELWGQIDGNLPPAHLHVAEPGVDVSIRRDLLVRPFRVRHPSRGREGQRIDALGFTVIEVRKKLKEEFAGLMGPQIVELKNKGVEITHRIEHAIVTYCGDTALGDFLDLPYVRDSRILILECTFTEPGHLDRARHGNHLHVSDLSKVLARVNNERILLTHLTRRTSLKDARKALKREIGEEAARERVTFLAEHRRRRREAAPEAPEPEPSE